MCSLSGSEREIEAQKRGVRDYGVRTTAAGDTRIKLFNWCHGFSHHVWLIWIRVKKWSASQVNCLLHKNNFFAAECPLAPSGRPPDRQPETVREDKIPSGNLFLVVWGWKYSGIRKKIVIIFLDRRVVGATVGERSPSLWKTGRISIPIWTFWLFCWKYWVSLKLSFIAQ